jgi:hypothetical protein
MANMEAHPIPAAKGSRSRSIVKPEKVIASLFYINRRMMPAKTEKTNAIL